MPREQFAFYPSLKSMPVIVSGGASGIGEEIVRSFAAQDSKVGFVDMAADKGRRLEAELRAAGRTVRFVHCDITDVGAYKAAIAKLEEEALHRRTRTERQSDAVVRFIGSPKFLLLHIILVAGWIAANLNLIPGVRAFLRLFETD